MDETGRGGRSRSAGVGMKAEVLEMRPGVTRGAFSVSGRGGLAMMALSAVSTRDVECRKSKCV